MDANAAGLFEEGVSAVATITERLGGDDWDQRACGEWTAAETVLHLVAVSEWYQEWLDRAVSGHSSPPFAATELPARNAAAIVDLEGLAPTAAFARFTDTAMAYLDRARTAPDLPFGFPFGTGTVGLHVGVAATERHLHAWDLSSIVGPRHVPSDPAGLFVAAGRCSRQRPEGSAERCSAGSCRSALGAPPGQPC